MNSLNGPSDWDFFVKRWIVESYSIEVSGKTRLVTIEDSNFRFVFIISNVFFTPFTDCRSIPPFLVDSIVAIS
jgi:hypothetical protein